MSIATNLANVFTRIGTEFKSLRGLINGGSSNLSGLNTTNKTNLVAAINELAGLIGNAGAQIDDTVISAAKVWSSTKTDSEIKAAVAALVSAAPDLLNTFDELANALGDDPNFATTIMQGLAAKAPLDSPTFTGTVAVPDGSFSIAKTTGLQGALDNKITAFADPNADRIVFWDDSVGAFAALSLSGLTITGTTIAPDVATTTTVGVIEVATLAEVTTGTDATRAVTPQGLAQQIATRAASTHSHPTTDITGFQSAVDGRVNTLVPAGTSTTPGKLQLATLAEVGTGTDTAKAVTPAGVAQQISTRAAASHTHTASQISDFASAVDARIPATQAASSTQAGVVQLATDAEAAAGTVTGKAVTPSNIRAVTGDPETNFVTVFEAALV